ncbi:MAG: trypsin-like peptidase domain-containing protein [Planctomycetaceae bacterium]|jgi:serine protease Do|nr:trypsin-like peptidase domain-containing protein [Planctomycetaceae bacterium]
MLREYPIIATLTILFITPVISLFADDYNREKIYKARYGTVVIEGDKIDTSRGSGLKDYTISYNGVGAGIIIDPRGYIITNYHVIDGIRKIQVKTFDGAQYQGQYICHDPVTDIALIKITPNKPLEPIRIGDSSKVREMDLIAVIGHPFGYIYSVNRGDVSGVNREVLVTQSLKYTNLFQVTAAINPGNSGGPLLNTEGEMVGINSALRQGSMLIAFSIPGDFVMEVGAELVNQHTSQYCYHGIRFKKVDLNLIGTSAINIEDYKIVAINSVDSGSPAEEAGIQAGDIIISANDIPAERKLDFQRAFLELQEKNSVKIVFERSGRSYETEIKLRNPRSRNNHITIASSSTSLVRTTNSINQPVANQPTKKNKTEMILADYIWNTFGIRIQPVSQDELNRQNPRLVSSYEFLGAVLITEIKNDCLFYRQGLRTNDYLAGIVTAKDQWNIMVPEDLKYIGEHWSPREMGDVVQMLVVRDQKLHEGNLPVMAAVKTQIVK